MPTPTPPAKGTIAAKWRARVHAWTQSGQSAPVFAAAHGFKPAALYTWRRRLRDEARAAPPVAPAPRLVQVTLEGPALCELALPDGRVLRFPSTLAPATLRALLDVLESP